MIFLSLFLVVFVDRVVYDVEYREKNTMLLLTDDHLLLNQEMTDDDVCGDVDYNGQMIEVKILKLLVLLEVETQK